MKATGIVRKIDELGRVVLPKELLRTLNISPGDPMEIYTEGKQIVLQKYERGCLCCGGMDDLYELSNGMLVCKKCLKELK